MSLTTAGTLFAASQAWPLAGLDAITAGRAVILAPHPDDESLGCGGLIASACAAGQPPFVVVLTDGAGSHPNSASHPPERLRALREAETLEAAACLGLAPDHVAFLREPDTRAPSGGDVVDRLCAFLGRVGAASLLASWRHDPHCDHEAASGIAAQAASRMGLLRWEYPVWGRTLPMDTPLPAQRGLRLDVSGHAEAKRQAIRAHRSQWAGLITDDRAGFQMQPGFMALFDTATELFLEPA